MIQWVCLLFPGVKQMLLVIFVRGEPFRLSCYVNK